MSARVGISDLRRRRERVKRSRAKRPAAPVETPAIAPRERKANATTTAHELPKYLPPEVFAVLRDADALRALDTKATPPEIRAHAVAELGFQLGRSKSNAVLEEAASRIATAQTLRKISRLAQARLAHAEGYVLYQQGRDQLPVIAYNRAIDLFPRDHHLRPRVFDSLGQYFQHTAGDLDRARSYYEESYAQKQRLAERYGLDAVWESLAITAGNLGRLELTLERWEEAKRWTTIDLELEQQHGARARSILQAVPPAALGESARATAMLHGQLARIAITRCERGAPASRTEILDEAAEQLQRAFELVPAGTYTEVMLHIDAARLALLHHQRDKAEAAIATAEELVRRGAYEHLQGYVHFVRGLYHGAVTPAAGEPDFSLARHEFDTAMTKFAAVNQPQEQCEVILAKAELLIRNKYADDARRLLVDRGVDVAERQLFGQLQPLARLEQLLAQIDPGELAQLRARRMRGGIPAEEHTGRLRGERRHITVWTCDIRGFAAYSDAHDDAAVVATLNRFFRAIGEPILAARGYIDKYVGDNILAYFTSASTAAAIAMRALEVVAQLNTEWLHLRETPLQVGVGIATGEAVVGTVGFAGKLEHTIIGSTVNLACRLVGVAGPGEIAIDRETARAIASEYRTQRWGRTGTVELKGFGGVPAFRLVGRKSAP